MAVCNCFLQAPQLSRFFLPVISHRATNLPASYARLKSTFNFSSAVNRTRPLTSPVRAEVKRISRKDDEVALASDLLFETPLKIVEYPDPILRAKNKRIGRRKIGGSRSLDSISKLPNASVLLGKRKMLARR